MSSDLLIAVAPFWTLIASDYTSNRDENRVFCQSIGEKDEGSNLAFSSRDYYL
jgi:hypothetical protein